MNPDVFTAADLSAGLPPPLSQYGRRFLAEGDSWFTIGRLSPLKNSNLLKELQFAQQHVVISCAYPGDTLQQMAAGLTPGGEFDRLLRHPTIGRYWEAIFVSAGGNDLIDAAQHRPLRKDGSAALLTERILLTPAEAAAVKPGVAGPERYISEPGWALLAGYLKANFAALVAAREQGQSRGRPVCVHTYHVPVVRPSGTVGASEGWLYPALRAYAIPAGERQGLAAALFERLRTLLRSLDSSAGGADALPQFHVFDSAALAALTPSDPQASGDSGDWVNEIHPNPAGYKKIGAKMGPWVDQLLAGYP
ncbi:MAG TPA: hypothetical protein VLI72_06165 [Methylibium sp.]|nr:hypothetical protein [Methylibium sp.]